MESTRVAEDILDPSECVQYLWNLGGHGTSERVSISDLLPGQALLHFLGSEEGEAAVDRILFYQLNACLNKNQSEMTYERIVTRQTMHKKFGHCVS